MLKIQTNRLSSRRGFTLVELMIVIVIIGLLAALGIPSYMQYAARAQVSEAYVLTAAVKAPAIEWIKQNASLPDSINSITSTVSGKYVQSIYLDGSAEELQIVARMKPDGVNNEIQDKLFVLSTNNEGQTWSCSHSTISNNYLPSACGRDN